MNFEIEEFGRMLVERVRDAAVRSNDRALTEEHVLAKRWKEAASSGIPAVFADVLVPDIVDSTLFYLLHAIDSGRLRLSFMASNGNTVDLSAKGLGELAGWYMGSGGWRAQYAKERVADDCSDLT